MYTQFLLPSASGLSTIAFLISLFLFTTHLVRKEFASLMAMHLPQILIHMLFERGRIKSK